MEKKETYFVDIDGTIFKYRKFETYKSSHIYIWMDSSGVQATSKYDI